MREPGEILTSEQSTERANIWRDLDNEFIEKEVEPGIRELVVGLNVVTCKTWVSCEGHNRHSIRRHIKPDGISYLEWEHPYVAFTGELRYVRRSQSFIKLQQLIDDFYQDRTSEPKYRITLTKFAEYNTQISVGGFNTVDLPVAEDGFSEERLAITRNLGHQQRELRKFGEYLKKRYLEAGPGIDMPV